MITKEVLINTIKSRVFELKQALNKEVKVSERMSIQEALQTNISWLIQLGEKVEA
jgi:hypothetical protein